MSKKTYCIHRLYQARYEYHHCDQIGREDKWQLEVYLHTLGLMKKDNLNSVVDIGCGSAYKLLTYLGDYDTICVEVPQTCEWLKEKYPRRKWLISDFEMKQKISGDVVICADAIEHLVEPDTLMTFIKGISFKYLVMSTPDRHLLYRPWDRGYWGPPKNKSHQREWSYKEFHKYVSIFFDVIDHRVTNLAQSTQMVICRQREKSSKEQKVTGTLQ